MRRGSSPDAKIVHSGNPFDGNEAGSSDKLVKQKGISFSRNYLIMTREELEDVGISGCRLNLAMILRSKVVDVSSIVLILFYSVLIFFYFLVEDVFLFDNQLRTFLAVELSILSLFILECVLYLFAFQYLYLKEPWNIFDIFLVLLSFSFVIVDMLVEDPGISAFFKLRGLFRLLRIFLLFRKLNAMRILRDLDHRRKLAVVVPSQGGYGLKSPLERVLEILTKLRDQVDLSERTVISELAYCIRVISSNQLYEAELIIKGISGGGNLERSEHLASQGDNGNGEDGNGAQR